MEQNIPSLEQFNRHVAQINQTTGSVSVALQTFISYVRRWKGDNRLRHKNGNSESETSVPSELIVKPVKAAYKH